MKLISNVVVKFLWITDEQITGPATSSEINKIFLAVTFFNKTCQSIVKKNVRIEDLNNIIQLLFSWYLPLMSLYIYNMYNICIEYLLCIAYFFSSNSPFLITF